MDIVSQRVPCAVIFLDIDGVLSNYPLSPDGEKKVKEKRSELWQSDPFYRDYSNYSPEQLYHLSRARALMECLDPQALENLELLVKRISSTIQPFFVISSSWREVGSRADLEQHVFAKHEWLANKIIGKTPNSERTYKIFQSIGRYPPGPTPHDLCREKYQMDMHSRGRQIKFWLEQHREQYNVQSYVILDDVCDGDTEIPALHPGCFVKVNSRNLLTEENVDQAVAIVNAPLPNILVC